MPQRPPASDHRTRLALGCSALARAGQQLSTANTTEQARAALAQVADQLESDQNLAQLIPATELSQRCREAAGGSEASVLLAACRQMATSLARRASSLAAEVHQKAVSAPAAAPPAPTAVEVPVPVQEAVPETSGVPVVPPAAAAVPPAPVVEAERVRRLTIVENPAEREAVEAALEVGTRFARVRGMTLVDTETNRMWQAQLSNGMAHAVAMEAVRGSETGGYHDWRLPTVEEMRALLAQGGLQGLRSLGVLPAMSAPLLWTSAVRSRFFGFKKEGAVFHSGSGEMAYRALSDSAVRVLAVRGQ